jgi:hypothetical protein
MPWIMPRKKSMINLKEQSHRIKTNMMNILLIAILIDSDAILEGFGYKS